MTSSSSAERIKPSPLLWLVLALLSLSLLINYVDRSSISIAAPLIKAEFGLSASRLGIIFAAFSYTYAAFLILSGWLVDRYNVGWVLAIGFAVWSSATLLTGFAHGFAAFLLLRLLLGMGESVAYPSYSRIMVRHFPEHRRGFANSVISIGMPGGLAVGTFTGAILMGRFGWRPFFIVLGLGTLLWLIPWSIWMPRGPGIAVPASNQAAPSIWKIVQEPSVWGTCGGLFTLNFLLYFMINWLPLYLVQTRHFALSQVATVGFVYLVAAVVSPLGGWLSDLWIASGATPTRVRKTFMAAGQAGCAIFLAGCVVANPKFTLVFLLLSGVGFGFSNSQTWAITQTLAGPNASGKWTGLQNFVGNFAGILGPTITGVVIDRTGGFFWAFVITVVVGILGSASWIFAVGPLKQISWQDA
jgi:ACS family D-galactonate transporter-like MFS transporter